MQVLVTGGAGFIGSNFINLSPAGHPDRRFINVDCLAYSANLANVADSAKAFDLTAEALVRLTVTSRYQWVINYAAWTDVDGAEAKEGEAAAITSQRWCDGSTRERERVSAALGGTGGGVRQGGEPPLR